MDDPLIRLSFGNVAETYHRVRPPYWQPLLDRAQELLALGADANVLDLAAGTGRLTRELAQRFAHVVAVEPNDAMRAAAERSLGSRPRFSIVRGTAEATGLADASADFATAAQAFHWFDPTATRAELLRVTRPPHPVALLWNRRSLDATPFLRAYDELLVRVSDDYLKVRHENVGPAVLAAFYGEGGYERRVFPSAQVFDEDGFLGRALSSSYVPAPGHPRHDETVRGLREIFTQHQNRGTVALLYETEVYTGHLASTHA